MAENLRKVVLFILVFAILTVLMTGCGKDSKDTPQNSTEKPTHTKEESVILKWAMQASLAGESKYKDQMALVEEFTGNKVEPILLPGDAMQANDKLIVSLMGGDEIDFVYTNEPNAQKFADSQLFVSLNEIMEEKNYDAEAIYGSALKKYDGQVLFLPSLKDTHITIYNKKIFDDANVPYPDNDTWTWEKYIETTKKLTDSSKGIYGSYMLDWSPYFTFTAKQKKVPAYTPDGTSNFDDPAWAESFKFFADLGNVYKVQPDFLTWKSKKMQYDAFMTGKYGVFVVGNWALGLVADRNTYPRDWEAGIAIMPQVEKGQKIALSIIGGYAVTSTSKHPYQAFGACKALAENAWTLPYGEIPARIDLDAEQMSLVSQTVVESLKEDGVTEEEVQGAFLNSEMDLVNELITGPGMTMINDILIPQIGELYSTGQRTLEQAMKGLKEKADAAITEDSK